jgi:hypothetical protein
MTQVYVPDLATGCDKWTGARYCDRWVPGSLHFDEVSDEMFCPEHAGPLAWSARQVNLYSLALRVAGEVDRPIPVPAQQPAQLDGAA